MNGVVIAELNGGTGCRLSCRVLAARAPGQVLIPALLEEVYGLDADVVPAPLLGHPVVVPRTPGDRLA
jgi:iron complex transport system ATP-binding protein